jgi:hypothetical protein
MGYYSAGWDDLFLDCSICESFPYQPVIRGGGVGTCKKMGMLFIPIFETRRKAFYPDFGIQKMDAAYTVWSKMLLSRYKLEHSSNQDD